MAKMAQTDEHAKKKAIKLVVLHIKKKLDEAGEEAHEFDKWFDEMDKLLKKDEKDFSVQEYYEMRRSLNNHIDCIYDVSLRYKLRDSWISFGKALDKKAKKQI